MDWPIEADDPPFEGALAAGTAVADRRDRRRSSARRVGQARRRLMTLVRHGASMAQTDGGVFLLRSKKRK